ncbi:hypothetical protein P9112_012258 [Eukaryota sp. TZLM1-RC]
MDSTPFNVKCVVIRYPDILDPPRPPGNDNISEDPLSSHIKESYTPPPFELYPIPSKVLENHSFELSQSSPFEIYLGEVVTCHVSFTNLIPVAYFSPSVFTQTDFSKDHDLFDRSKHTEKHLPANSTRSFLVKFTVRQALSPSFSLVLSPIFDGKTLSFSFPFTVQVPFTVKSSLITPTHLRYYLSYSLQPLVPSAIRLKDVIFRPSSLFKVNPLPSLFPSLYMSPSDVHQFVFEINPITSQMSRDRYYTSNLDVGLIDVNWETEDLRVGQFVTKQVEVSYEIVNKCLLKFELDILFCPGIVSLDEEFEIKFRSINHLSRDLHVRVADCISHDSSLVVDGVYGDKFTIPSNSGIYDWSMKFKAVKRGQVSSPSVILSCENQRFALPTTMIVVL